MAALVTLDEAKAHLNLSGSAEDAELLGMVEAVTAPIERIVGAVLPATYTERHDGGGAAIALLHPPVLSVTSVTLADGTVLTADDYEVDAIPAVLTRVSAGSVLRWERGRISVVYLAGMSSVPANVRLAALITVQHMWRTQRGSRDQRFTGGEETWNPGMGFSLPRRALELLGSKVPGIA